MHNLFNSVQNLPESACYDQFQEHRQIPCQQVDIRDDDRPLDVC